MTDQRDELSERLRKKLKLLKFDEQGNGMVETERPAETFDELIELAAAL